MNFPPEYQKPPQSLGDWIISILITKIPLVGFIVLIIWALDKNTEQSKANWAKAELIVTLIGFIIFLLILSLIGFGFFMNFAEQIDLNSFE